MNDFEEVVPNITIKSNKIFDFKLWKKKKKDSKLMVFDSIQLNSYNNDEKWKIKKYVKIIFLFTIIKSLPNSNYIESQCSYEKQHQKIPLPFPIFYYLI